jgi:acyl carrier protein
MSLINQSEFSEALRTFLKSSQSFTDTDNLMRLGVVDSLQIMQLISFLEQRFSVRIAPEHITTENFSSIEGMRTLVDSLNNANSH